MHTKYNSNLFWTHTTSGGIFGRHKFRRKVNASSVVLAAPLDCVGRLHNCSGHGFCRVGRCYCAPGFTGQDCSLSSLSPLSDSSANGHRGAKGTRGTLKSRRLAAFFFSDSKWHWVAVALMTGFLLGFSIPWKRCSLGPGTKRSRPGFGNFL